MFVKFYDEIENYFHHYDDTCEIIKSAYLYKYPWYGIKNIFRKDKKQEKSSILKALVQTI